MNVDVFIFVYLIVNVYRNIWNIDMCNEFFKFMIKKDFLFFCLIKYDDKLDMYMYIFLLIFRCSI